mmetsp:Transcript_59920/g.121656  ORF Transcript_59920/g.121656 Transcript_59920/m.121656 type:complete len:248 (+) Transcript_59920:248-991(+)
MASTTTSLSAMLTGEAAGMTVSPAVSAAADMSWSPLGFTARGGTSARRTGLLWRSNRSRKKCDKRNTSELKAETLDETISCMTSEQNRPRPATGSTTAMCSRLATMPTVWSYSCCHMGGLSRRVKGGQNRRRFSSSRTSMRRRLSRRPRCWNISAPGNRPRGRSDSTDVLGDKLMPARPIGSRTLWASDGCQPPAWRVAKHSTRHGNPAGSSSHRAAVWLNRVQPVRKMPDSLTRRLAAIQLWWLAR